MSRNCGRRSRLKCRNSFFSPSDIFCSRLRFVPNVRSDWHPHLGFSPHVLATFASLFAYWIGQEETHLDPREVAADWDKNWCLAHYHAPRPVEFEKSIYQRSLWSPDRHRPRTCEDHSNEPNCANHDRLVFNLGWQQYVQIFLGTERTSNNVLSRVFLNFSLGNWGHNSFRKSLKLLSQIPSYHSAKRQDLSSPQNLFCSFYGNEFQWLIMITR